MTIGFLRLLPVLACVLALGCGGGRSSEDKMEAWDALSAIANGYPAAAKKLGRPPANIDELAPHINPPKPEYVAGLRSGKYVVVYGADVSKLQFLPDANQIILVYESRTPTQGGYAAPVVGGMLTLTPEQFKTHKLADSK